MTPTLTKAQVAAVTAIGSCPESGQVWAVGRHRMVIGDLQDDDVLSALLGLGPWDACWTDPPWDDRIGKQFRKQAGATVEAMDLPRVFDHLTYVLSKTVRVAAVWTGKPAQRLAASSLADAGLTDQQVAEVLYVGTASTTPVTVGSYDEGVVHEMASAIDGAPRGVVQIAQFMDAYEDLFGPPPAPHDGQWWRLVDAFAGQECLAAMGGRENWSLTGAELHPGRAARTLAQWAKQTGEKAVIVTQRDETEVAAGVAAASASAPSSPIVTEPLQNGGS